MVLSPVPRLCTSSPAVVLVVLAVVIVRVAHGLRSCVVVGGRVRRRQLRVHVPEPPRRALGSQRR